MHRTWIGLAITLGLMAITAAQAAGPDLCLTSAGGLAGVPQMNGIVSGDAGWNGALQVNLSGDLGMTTASKMLIGRAVFQGQDSLLIGLVVDAPTPGLDTTVELVLSPGSGTANDWRLHLHPFDVEGPVAIWWQDSSTWNSPGAMPNFSNPGDWQLKNLKATKSGNHWELTFVVPIVAMPGVNGFCMGCGGSPSFLIYANVLNVTLGQPAMTGQDVWPPCPQGTSCPSILPGGSITQTTPPSSAWGKVWLANNAACTGVRLDWTGIGVQDPNNAANLVQTIRRLSDAQVPQTDITKCIPLADNAGPNGPTNIFEAKPLNTMGGQAQINVTFRLANWGIPGAGQFTPLGTPVPAGCNPLVGGGQQCAGVNNNPTPQAAIAAGATGDFQATWALNLKQSCFFKFQTHQCIEVDMDSNDPNTRLLNRSVQKNMDFVPASVFSRSAKISGNQGKLPAGQSRHRILLVITEDQGGQVVRTPVSMPNPREPRERGFRDPMLTQNARRLLGEKFDHLLAWIMRSYVFTGDQIIIRKHSYEYARRAGDFGYVVGHAGPMSAWNWKVSGEGLRQVGKTPDIYLATVSPKQEISLDTVIQATERGGKPFPPTPPSPGKPNTNPR
jgi:hypothetical protein